jgi:cytoskeletal protein RodZ
MVMDYPDVNPLVPGGPGFGFHWFWTIGSFLFGLVLFAAFVVVIVLLVRYLLVATKAHQHYLDSHRTSSTSASSAPATSPTTPPTTPTTDPTPPNVPAGTKPTRTRTPKPPAAS